MIVNEGNLFILGNSLRTAFDEAILEFKVIWPQLAMTMPSDGRQETYAWLGELPGMQEWVGDRVLAKMEETEYTVKNKKWSNGIEVDREDIEDDKTGMISMRVRRLAEMAAVHKDELISNLLINAFTDTGYDGEFFVDTDHGTLNQSNKTTAALATASFESAMQAGEELTREDGKPRPVYYDKLVCGPSNRATAVAILEAEKLASGASNTNFQRVELLVNPWLVGSSAAYWFLIDTKQTVQGLFLQLREDATFTAMDDPTSPEVFKRDKFQYGAQGRWVGAYGLWQFVHGSDGTT